MAQAKGVSHLVQNKRTIPREPNVAVDDGKTRDLTPAIDPHQGVGARVRSAELPAHGGVDVQRPGGQTRAEGVAKESRHRGVHAVCAKLVQSDGGGVGLKLGREDDSDLGGAGSEPLERRAGSGVAA